MTELRFQLLDVVHDMTWKTINIMTTKMGMTTSFVDNDNDEADHEDDDE